MNNVCLTTIEWSALTEESPADGLFDPHMPLWAVYVRPTPPTLPSRKLCFPSVSRPLKKTQFVLA
jgi:hypothetical protein